MRAFGRCYFSSNRALVRLQLINSFPDRATQAMEDSAMCQHIDPHYAKGIYCKVKALLKLKRWHPALVAAHQCKQLHPVNPDIEELCSEANRSKAGWRRFIRNISFLGRTTRCQEFFLRGYVNFLGLCTHVLCQLCFQSNPLWCAPSRRV
jgi:hypothetical protein